MSANEMRSESEQHGSSLGSRLTKKLSKRLSIGSKEADTNHPGSNYEKDMSSGRKSVPDTQTAREQVTMASSDAAHGSAATAKQETSQIPGTQGIVTGDDSRETSAGDQVNAMSAQELDTRAGDRRSSITPGVLVYNDDIKRGPITTGIRRDTGQSTHGGVGSSQDQASNRDAQSSLASNQAQQGLNQDQMGSGMTDAGTGSAVRSTDSAYGTNEMKPHELSSSSTADGGISPTDKSSSPKSGKPGFAAFGNGPLGNIFRRASGQGSSNKNNVNDERFTQMDAQQPKSTDQSRGISGVTAAGIGIGAGAGAALGAPGVNRGVDLAGTDKAGMNTKAMNTDTVDTTGMSNAGMNTNDMSTGMSNNRGMDTRGVDAPGMSTGSMNTGTGSMNARGMNTSTMNTSPMDTSGMDTSGMSSTGMSNSHGMDTRGVDAPSMSTGNMNTGTGNMNTSGMNTSPMNTTGMNTSGMNTIGMSNTGMSNSRDMDTRGVDAPGMSTGSMNTSGMNNLSGMSTAGTGNLGMSSDKQASILKSRDGGVVRGGTAVMGGASETSKPAGSQSARMPGKEGTTATGVAGAAGLVGAAGAAGVAAKSAMPGQHGDTGTFRESSITGNDFKSKGGIQKTAESLPGHAPVAAAGGAGIVGMSPAKATQTTSVSSEPGMPGAFREAPVPTGHGPTPTKSTPSTADTGLHNSSARRLPVGLPMPSQPAPPGTRVMDLPDSSDPISLAKASSRGQHSSIPSSTTTSTTTMSTRAVRGLSMSMRKVTVLQDRLQTVSQKCKTQLGTSTSEISQRSPTVDSFFDAVATERLRWMPRDGSRLDCSLRWASRLASAVDALRKSTESFAPGAEAASQLIWGFMIMMLESDLDDTDLFDSIFGRYGRVAVGLYLLIQYESAYKNSTQLQPQATAVFADLLEMVCNTTTSVVEGFKAKESSHLTEHSVDSAFITYAKRYSTHWNNIVESSTHRVAKQSSLINSNPELGSLRQFLGVQDRPLQLILDSRLHSLAEGSFEWFNGTLYDFSIGKAPVLVMTGDAGSGKSALAQWTVERLQESSEHESWNVIPYTIRADIPVATLTLRLLKGILHQMLDHCVGDRQLQEATLAHVANAAQGAMNGASEYEVEEHLWQGIHAGLGSTIKFMFVIDGMDQIKAGDADVTDVLNKFTNILSQQNAGSKMIVFTRPLSSKTRPTGVEQTTMQTAQTRQDLVDFVTKKFRNSLLTTTKSDHLQSAVAAVVTRSQGSFSWAEMAVEYAKQQRTLAEAVSAVQSLPQPMTELLDFHLNNLDLSQREAVSVLSWLASSERPLLVEEVEELLRVNTSGPSLSTTESQDESQWSRALKPLVVTRFGVVSFAHTSIRDHVIMKAKSANVKTPLDLKEAHLDLLMRCLGWVQLRVREETDVSMDKLSMDERHRLFDKYVILEYTARYWLSHFLSSNLVTDDGEFIFASSFRKLLPTSILFARVELTCKESQFTRSSVVDLYRIATDIRRLVLGEKSLALLESVLLSARVAKYAHATYADEHCSEAWRLSQELLGQSDPITLKCTEMMTQSFMERGTMTPQQEDIMRYLILTDSEVSGVDFNQRLKYLGILVGMYKSQGDNESGLMISKQFYNGIVEKHGTNSRQSTEAAEFLAGQFSTDGSDEISRDIARTKYDNITRTMGVTDERRIKYSLYMAQLYEQQGQYAQAHTVLSSLWAGLNARDIDSVDMMDKKANVALIYYQFLRRQGRNDEAEVIMHELVSDLQTSGIQSPEMMQRVQLLRAETREMQMHDLDRSLCILMWQYYKGTHKEHTPEARNLALSLAEDMAKPVASNDPNAVSGNDRKLMVELLDSIASSPSNISVPTLLLCHNLASIYVRDEDWTGASESSRAVLRHVHPNVEQAGSHKKFTTELAPPVTDLALILAYCHFRKFHLEQASIVYDNAFGSLIASDRVPVASVLAVAKAVVEFYETTFQFPQALGLLHTVSNFLTSRLGENDKHTIDNMYREAAMAKRLEMDKEAKTTYQRIYKNTLKGDITAPAGMQAALALIDLFEREKQWGSALEVYRHVWPTIVVQDNVQPSDRRQTEVLLDQIYKGYMNILGTDTKGSNFPERYRVCSDYVNTCRNVHGPTHHKTLEATLLFAELCESHDPYTDQAIALYKQPLQTNEWVPTAQATRSLDQMNQSLPITLKHKLAQLYVRKRDSTSEARSLYTEEFQLGKKTQGYFSNTTLAWLRELALAHSRQATPTSVQQGNALLHNYVMDCLHADGDTTLMAQWARKIAAIYLECGFIEGGNNVLDELRQRVVSGPELSTLPLSDRKDAVFAASFEEVFGRRASAAQIMEEIVREMQTQQSFSRSLSSHEFIPTLITGDHLCRLQTEQNRTQAATATRNKLYEYFCATLSAMPVADRDVIKQFYKLCVKEAHHDGYKKKILTTTTKMVRDLCHSSRFQDASDLAGVLHSFLHLTDSLTTRDNIITASKLCLYLTGHQATKCDSPSIQAEMSAKSNLLLQELMTNSKSVGMEIVDLPFHELNDFITLLGEHEMFDDLEGVLTQLWTSRIVQRTWTPDVVVWIGRRLVETRFCRGSVDSAIQLCRDICYNLRQVWGSCDPVTLEMTKLLSALFTASNDHKSAAALHEGALHDLLADSDAKDHPHAADTASQHMELLRRSQSRLGTGQGSSSRSSNHVDLLTQVTNRFGLKDAQIQGVGNANGGDQFGVWSRPRRFSIDVDDLDDEGQPHHNHLRETSGGNMTHGSGAARRISVQAL